jgi:hypothetical protein
LTARAELRRITQPRQVELSSFPSPAELADRTPANRDRAIHVIRITALIGVVVGHTVMATSVIRDNVLIWDNLLLAGVATLATIRWGLKDDGLICVATMVTALVTARVLAAGVQPSSDLVGHSAIRSMSRSRSTRV